MAESGARLRFSKMHGAGNDFVILDRRGLPELPAVLAAKLADRRFGIGCDQVITIERLQTIKLDLATEQRFAALITPTKNAKGARRAA